MGRIVREINLNGEEVTALFDTGAFRSYIREDTVPEGTQCTEATDPIRTHIGGKEHVVTKKCLLKAAVEDGEFDIAPNPIPDIGAADGEEIDLLIGATVMEEWDIRPIPKQGRLDFVGVREREFTEF